MIRDYIGTGWMIAAKAIVIVIPLIMIALLIYKSMPVISEFGFWSLVTGNNWKPLAGDFGFWPFIVSSIWVSILALLISGPICVLAAIFLSEYAPKSMLKIMQPIVDVLAGIPSVVYGVWGILVIVPFVGEVLAPAMGIETTGYSILAGSLVLSVMIIPFMLNIMLELLKTVPIEMREAALSMGASKWEMVKVAVLRRVAPGIASSLGLGLARAIGETIAVLMVVGNTVGIPKSIFSPAYPLPALIANNYGEMLSIPRYDSALMFAALALLIIIVSFNVIMRLLIRRFEKKYA